MTPAAPSEPVRAWANNRMARPSMPIDSEPAKVARKRSRIPGVLRTREYGRSMREASVENSPTRPGDRTPNAGEYTSAQARRQHALVVEEPDVGTGQRDAVLRARPFDVRTPDRATGLGNVSHSVSRRLVDIVAKRQRAVRDKATPVEAGQPVRSIGRRQGSQKVQPGVDPVLATHRPGQLQIPYGRVPAQPPCSSLFARQPGAVHSRLLTGADADSRAIPYIRHRIGLGIAQRNEPEQQVGRRRF